MSSRARRGRAEGAGGSRSRTRREEREEQEDDSLAGGGVVEQLSEQSVVVYSALPRRSDGVVFLLAHGLTLAIMIINVCVIYFTIWMIGSSTGGSFSLVPLFERISSAYNSLSRGNIKYECSYGGSTIQHLECELKIGLNRVFFQLIAQGMEFIYMIFSPKNLFTLTSSVYALAKLTAELMRTTLPVVSTTFDNFKSYYTLIHGHSEIAIHRLLND